MRPSSEATARPSAFRRGISLDHTLGFGDLFGARREGFVRRRDLIGMDQRLAGKAEIAALAAGGGERIHIFEIGQHRIERIEAMRTRRQHANLQRGH